MTQWFPNWNLNGKVPVIAPCVETNINVSARQDSPVAVIDIGSNSVRVVIFDGLNRVPRVLFNEKVLCGLGRGLAKTHQLHPKGREQALVTLARFEALWRGIGVAKVLAVATAAVRDAKDGVAFCKEAETVIGHSVQILSGEEEGIFSALGVISGMPNINGVIGDLGGGSLEFARVNNGQVREVMSLPLGPQRIPNPDDIHDTRNVDYINEQLHRVPWRRELAGLPLIAVGGAWRSIARLHMHWESYPLHFIQGYTLDHKGALDISQVIALQSQKSAFQLEGVPKRRLSTLPISALVLKRVLSEYVPSSVIFSAYGLREGLIYDRLIKSEQALDPLIYTAHKLGESVQRQSGFGQALAIWSAPTLKSKSPEVERLRQTACELADLAWHQHPDHRGIHARDIVLRTPFAGVTHQDRAFLAVALWTRYGSRLDHHGIGPLVDFIGLVRAKDAMTLGLVMRLGVNISGGSRAVLKDTELRKEGLDLVLDLSRHPEWYGDAVERRMAAVADALGGVEFRIIN